jgi:acetyltransferase
VFVEVLDDVAVAAAPLSEDEAGELIARLRGFPVLTGARGREAVDLGAAARLLARVGDLMAAAPDVAELDLNPVLCGPTGCVVVDWRVRGQNLPFRDKVMRRDSPTHGRETEPHSS